MAESYTPAEAALAGALIGRLHPACDPELLLAALLAEHREAPMADDLPMLRASDQEPPARELRRVRAQLAVGEAARPVQHAANNFLTALLAEAQLLELELHGEAQGPAAGRIVALARQMVAVMRRLDLAGSGRSIG